jgi:hypothetical protein
MRHLAIFLFAAALFAFAGTKPQQFSNSEDVDLSGVPTTPTDVVTRTVFLDAWKLSNTTGSGISCTIQNKAGTPVVLWTGTVPANTYGGDGGDGNKLSIRMTGGITWSCTGTGVNGYLAYRY